MQRLQRVIEEVGLRGVEEAYGKHTSEDEEAKGIKAHFRMDESGILSLDLVCRLHLMWESNHLNRNDLTFILYNEIIFKSPLVMT